MRSPKYPPGTFNCWMHNNHEGALLPLSERSGSCNLCRACGAAYQRQRRAASATLRQRNREDARAYARANPEKIAAIKQAERDRDKARRREAQEIEEAAIRALGLLAIKDAALVIGIEEGTLRKQMGKGRIAFVKRGWRSYIAATEAMRYRTELAYIRGDAAVAEVRRDKRRAYLRDWMREYRTFKRKLAAKQSRRAVMGGVRVSDRVTDKRPTREERDAYVAARKRQREGEPIELSALKPHDPAFGRPAVAPEFAPFVGNRTPIRQLASPWCEDCDDIRYNEVNA